MAGWWRSLKSLDEAGVPGLAVGVILGAWVVSGLWLAAGPVEAARGQVALAAAIGLALMAGSLVYARLRPQPVLAGWLGGLAVFLSGSLIAGFIAIKAVAAGFPLVDGFLARIDEAFGIDHPAMLRWLADRPLTMSILRWAYSLSVPLLYTMVVILAWRRHFASLATLLNLYVLCAVIVSLVSVFTPAVGVYAHYAIGPEILNALPSGAGLYHIDTFRMLRAGGELVLGPFDSNGVTTFPSFHICMALIVGHTLSAFPAFRLAGWAYCAVTAVATVLIGGHYVVDLVAGAAVFLASLGIARRLSPAPPREAGPRPLAPAPA